MIISFILFLNIQLVWKLVDVPMDLLWINQAVINHDIMNLHLNVVSK